MSTRRPLDLGSMPDEWRGTPLETLVRAHNLREPIHAPPAPELLVGTCMDHRIQLRLPPASSFLLRAAGADLRAAEFDIAVAVARRNIRTIAVITHTDCAMARASSQREEFLTGLTAIGWSRVDAEVLFDRHAASREIGDEAAFAVAEAARVGASYPTLLVAPLIYRVEDGMLYGVGAERRGGMF